MKFKTIAVQVMKLNRFQMIFSYYGDLQTVVNYDIHSQNGLTLCSNMRIFT